MLNSHRRATRPGELRQPGLAARWADRIHRLRIHRRRVALSALAGLLAAGLTASVLFQVTTAADPDLSSTATTTPPAATSHSAESTSDTAGSVSIVADGMRVFAVDTTDVAIPMAVGDEVELLGLVPTVQAMEAQIIADKAVVVGLNDRTVLLLLTTDQAHRAVEIRSVGRLALLGRRLP